MKLLFATLGLSMLMACAQGQAQGPGNGGPDASVLPDSGSFNFPDANRSFPDANRSLPDANTSFPDANLALPDGGAGVFCNTDTDCTTAGTCCFIAICVPGDNSSGICVPN